MQGNGSPFAFQSVNGFNGLTGDVTATAAGVSSYNSVVPMNKGGSNKNMTASAGAVVYSDADSLELTAVGTAGQVLTSAGTGTPVFSDPITATYLSSNNNGFNSMGGSAGTFIDFTSLSFAAGTWVITWQIVYRATGAATADAIYCAVSTTSGDSATGLTYGINRSISSFNTAVNVGIPIGINGYIVTPGSTTTYYFKGGVGTSVTNISIAYNAVAIRIK